MDAGLRLIRSGTQKQSLQILKLKFYAGLFEPLPSILLMVLPSISSLPRDFPEIPKFKNINISDASRLSEVGRGPEK